MVVWKEKIVINISFAVSIPYNSEPLCVCVRVRACVRVRVRVFVFCFFLVYTVPFF
jgi:hypothetical protein